MVDVCACVWMANRWLECKSGWREALGPLLKPEGTGKSSLDVGRVATDERVTELMIIEKEEGARGGWKMGEKSWRCRQGKWEVVMASRGGGLQRVQLLGRCSGDGAVRWTKGTTNVGIVNQQSRNPTTEERETRPSTQPKGPPRVPKTCVTRQTSAD